MQREQTERAELNALEQEKSAAEDERDSCNDFQRVERKRFIRRVDELREVRVGIRRFFRGCVRRLAVHGADLLFIERHTVFVEVPAGAYLRDVPWRDGTGPLLLRLTPIAVRRSPLLGREVIEVRAKTGKVLPVLRRLSIGVLCLVIGLERQAAALAES